MQPTIDRFGTITVDGFRFLSPKFVSSDVGVSIRPLELSGPKPESDHVEIQHECGSGKCQHALKPKCRCGCKGIGHSRAVKASNHTLEEYGEDWFSSLPPFGMYA